MRKPRTQPPATPMRAPARVPKLKLPAGWKSEDVTTRMKKGCATCGVLPEGKRLVHTVDSYPFPTSVLYCARCGVFTMRDWLVTQANLIRDFEDAHAKNLN